MQLSFDWFDFKADQWKAGKAAHDFVVVPVRLFFSHFLAEGDGSLLYYKFD